jgi:drug/metabolite transporter (DMT)-like permease
MNLDIRIPIGLLFSIIGAILIVFGLMTHSDAEMYRRSLGININLWWGLVLLAFGLVMLGLASLARGAAKKKASQPLERK